MRTEARDPGRVAILGAQTEEGGRLRVALADFGVSGARVDLYGSTRDEVLLSEYAGEARMVQEPDVEEIAGHDVVFVCEPGEVAESVLGAAGSGALVVDMVDCLVSGKRPPRVHMDINPQAVARHRGRCFAVPHPLTLVLAELLVPLERGPGLSETLAVILRPAADFGREGIEELREQTVRLLSFAEVPTEVFGRQLAFNVIPHGQPGGDRSNPDPRIRSEVAELLGWSEGRLALRLLTAPLFHGHGVLLRFRPRREIGLGELRDVLRNAGLFRAGSGEVPSTPLEMAGETKLELSEIADDGLGGFWIWAVAGEAGSMGARQAVRLAAEIGGL